MAQNESAQAAMLKLLDSLNDAVRDLKVSVDSMGRELALCRMDKRCPRPPTLSGEDIRADYFLSQMERYFECLDIQDDRSKVTTASFYLTGAAALWWSGKRVRIDDSYSWGAFSRDIKKLSIR